MRSLALLALLAAAVGAGGLLFVGHLVRLRRTRPEGVVRLLVWVVGLGPAVVTLVRPRALAVDFTAAVADGLWVRLSQLLTATTVALALTVLVIELSSRRQQDRPGRGLAAATALLFSTVVLSAVVVSELSITLLLAPLVLGAVYVAPRQDAVAVVGQLRLVLRTYVYGSLLALAVAPGWATFRIDTGGSQLYERDVLGLGQLTGLAPFPNTLGPLAATALLFELAQVGRRRGWAVHAAAAAAVLLLAQSRTSIGAAVVAVWFLRARRREVSGLRPSSVLLACSGAAAAAAALLVPSVQRPVLAGLATDDLATLNGRTHAWRFAWDQFVESPLTGVGPSLFDAESRGALGRKYAWIGSAHNQWVQSLTEGGVLGLLGLTVFLVAVVVAARRLAEVTGGLSLALVALLLLRSVTEVPLRMRGVDHDLLLLVSVFVLLISSSRAGPVRPEVEEQEPSDVPALAAAGGSRGLR